MNDRRFTLGGVTVLVLPFEQTERNPLPGGLVCVIGQMPGYEVWASVSCFYNIDNNWRDHVHRGVQLVRAYVDKKRPASVSRLHSNWDSKPYFIKTIHDGYTIEETGVWQPPIVWIEERK